MPDPKASALANVAASIQPEQGREVARTRDDPEGDLFAEFLGEVEGRGGLVQPPRRGPGRPPGSVNRTTLQLQRFLMAKGYRDPAEFLASLMSMDARELAQAMRPGKDGAKGEPTFDQVEAALALQARAASELMPYFHQKKPIAVEHRGDGQRPLIMINEGFGRAAPQAAGPARGMSVHDAEEVQQDQGVSSSAGAASDRTGAGDAG